MAKDKPNWLSRVLRFGRDKQTSTSNKEASKKSETEATHSQFLNASIGIETLGGAFTVILEQGLFLPCKRTEIFSTVKDNQDTLEVHVFQGTGKSVSDPGIKSLNRYSIREIPPARAGKRNIEVKFAVNPDGKFTLSAREGAKDLKIEVAGKLSYHQREGTTVLKSQVAEVLENIGADQIETRRFGDYPLLVECSQQCTGLEMPRDVAQRLAGELEDLVFSELDFDLAYMWLSICKNAVGDFTGAIETLLDGIRKSKQKGHLCATLAEICLEREQIELALRGAICAVEIGTDLYLAYHIVAESLYFYGKSKPAKKLRTKVPTVLENYMVERIQSLLRPNDEAMRKLVEDFARKFDSD